MKRKPVIVQLKKYLPKLSNDFWHINSGGCGTVAMSLATHLRNSGVRCNIVFVNSYSYTRQTQDAKITNNDAIDINDLIIKADKEIRSGLDSAKNWIQNGHVCVQIGDMLFDATGDVTHKYHAITDPISDQSMIVMLRQPAMWNTTFRRWHSSDIKSIHQRIRRISLICQPVEV